MLSAAIAYDELAKSRPDVVFQVVALMRSHPEAGQFAERLRGFNSEADRARALFMYMATWADEVAGQRAYEHPKWHYINIPYVPADTWDLSKQAPLDAENILSTLTVNAKLVRDPWAVNADKAIALCWIFHQIGDLHQPLHTVSMITAELPDGDRGGNRIFVRPDPESSPIRLHAFWDDAAGNMDEPHSVMRLARDLELRVQRFELKDLERRPFTDEAAFERWVREESYPLAVRAAYQGGTLAWASSEDRAVVLSSVYLQNAKELAVARVVLSGYRLADVLSTLRPYRSTYRWSTYPRFTPVAGTSKMSEGQGFGTRTPEEALLRARIKEFWRAVGAHDAAKRYELTTPTVRERVTLDEFRRTWSWQDRPEFPVQKITADLTKICSCVQLRLLRCAVVVDLTVETPGEPPKHERTAQMWEFADGQWYEAYSGAPSGRHCPGEPPFSR